MNKVIALSAIVILQGPLAHAVQPQVVAEIHDGGSRRGDRCDAHELQVLDDGKVIAMACGQSAVTILTLAADGINHLKADITLGDRADLEKTLQNLMELAELLSPANPSVN